MSSLFDELFGSLADESLKSRLRALIDGPAQASGQPKDRMVLAPKGHLKIERIDADGNVLETIEQDNLITDRALAIATKMMAGHGYLNPYVTSNNLNTLHYRYSDVPAILWRRVYSGNTYYTTSTTQPTSYSPYLYPIPYGLNYIGIGDGIDYLINVTDERAFELQGAWTIVPSENAVGGNRAETRTADDQVVITFHGTKLLGYFSYAPDGANIEVTVDGGAPQTISLYSADPSWAKEIILADNLADQEHTVTISHTGTGYLSGQASYLLAIEAVRANGLTSSRRTLFREFQATETKIATPEQYNTTNIAPFEFTLLKGSYGVKPDSERVVLDGQELVRVTVAPTQENEYKIDYETGTLQFARPLSGVQVTYETETPFPTGYGRAIIERPSPGDSDYPWYNTEDHVLYMIAEFPPGVPNYPITVREVGLFDFYEKDPQAQMFSIVRPGEIVKDTETGLRITWEIRLLG